MAQTAVVRPPEAHAGLGVIAPAPPTPVSLWGRPRRGPLWGTATDPQVNQPDAVQLRLSRSALGTAAAQLWWRCRTEARASVYSMRSSRRNRTGRDWDCDMPHDCRTSWRNYRDVRRQKTNDIPNRSADKRQPLLPPVSCSCIRSHQRIRPNRARADNCERGSV